MGTSDAPPDQTPENEQPLDQGVVAQEQATGQSTNDTPPPSDAPGQTPEQGDEPGTATGEADAPPEPSFEEQQASLAAAQSPAEPQVVPEGRPQAFSQGVSVSEASKRIDASVPASEEAYKEADSEEAKKAAVENSRTPNLVVGQRVQILDPNAEAGRMAYVLQIDYADGIQGMLANSGTHEARFAEVSDYIVRTRDGRSDILVVPPDELKPLDDIQGWGRGQI